MSHSFTSNSEVEHGLVVVPADRLGSVLFTVIFLLLTSGVGFWDLLGPAPAPKAIGAEEELAAARMGRATWADGTRMRLLDDAANDRSNLRHFLGPWLAALMLRYADEAGARTVVGRDGWLFLERRLNPPDLPPEIPARIWANIFRCWERRLIARGTRLFLIPVPRRAVAVADQLLADHDPKPEWDAAFLSALEERGVPHVDLLPALSGVDSTELWSRYDTHWSRRGQLVAAGVIADAMRERLGLDTVGREQRLAVLEGDVLMPQKKGLLAYAGLRLGSRAQRVLCPSDSKPSLMPLDHQHAMMLTGKGRSNAPLWIGGTSYVAGENLVPYLRLELGTKIFSTATKGQVTSQAMTKHFEQNRRPKDLMVDMPCDQVFQNMGRRDGTINLAHLSTRGLSAGVLSPTRFLSALLVVRGGQVVLDQDQVFASGDGALAVRADLGARHKRLFHMTVGQLNYSLPWPAEAETCVLPLISVTSKVEQVSLTYLDPMEGTPGTVEYSLVTPFRAEPKRLSYYPIVGRRESWSASIPVALGDSNQALWIPELGAQGQVQVLKIYTDGEPMDLGHEHLVLEGSLTGKSLVMIDLGNLEGVREILIRGNDYASDRIRAALIPALR